MIGLSVYGKVPYLTYPRLGPRWKCQASSSCRVIGSIILYFRSNHISHKLLTSNVPFRAFSYLPLYLPIHLPSSSKPIAFAILPQAPPKAAAKAKYQVRLVPPSNHVPLKFCWLKNCQLVLGSIHARLPYRMPFQPPSMLEAG